MSRTKVDPAHIQMQLKVTLLSIRPPIWRRLVVPSDIKLPKLHDVLQFAFGWTDSHLHAFRVEDEFYQTLIPGEPVLSLLGSGPERKDEKRFRLNDLLHAKGDRLVYEYDFGDSWEHEVLVEKLIPSANIRNAVCLDGKRSAPPEDCGGVPGYHNLLEVLANPKHPDHDYMLDWLGDPFEPEFFNLDALNKVLSKLKI